MLAQDDRRPDKTIEETKKNNTATLSHRIKKQKGKNSTKHTADTTP
jgi:hypothetical protein